MKNKFLFIVVLSFLLISGGLYAQDALHSKSKAWLSKTEGLKTGEIVTLFVEVAPLNHWHVYSLIETGAYMPTEFDFSASSGIQPFGKPVEKGEVHNEFDAIMGGDLNYFDKPVVFSQQVKILSKQPFVKGVLQFQACNDVRCIFPTASFDFELKVQ